MGCNIPGAAGGCSCRKDCRSPHVGEDPTVFLSCANLLAERRNIAPADVIAYAQRVDALGEAICLVQSCLLIGKVIIWKSHPGDCPLQTNLSLGAAGTAGKISGITSTITGAGAGATSGFAGLGGVLGGLGSVLSVASVVGMIASIPIMIWGKISAHHKIAVAREQAGDCDVGQAYNDWESIVEQGLAAGKMSPADAKSAVPTVEQQLLGALNPISHDRTYSTGRDCNYPCEIGKAIRALDLYNVEKGYDMLAARSPLSVSSLASQGGKYALAAGVAVTSAVLV